VAALNACTLETGSLDRFRISISRLFALAIRIRFPAAILGLRLAPEKETRGRLSGSEAAPMESTSRRVASEDGYRTQHLRHLCLRRNRKTVQAGIRTNGRLR